MTNAPKTRLLDMVNYLSNEEDIAEYLRQVVQDGDTALLAAAQDDIARARAALKLPDSSNPRLSS